MRWWDKFKADESGTTAVEYSVMIGFVLLVLIGAVAAFGSGQNGKWIGIGDKWELTECEPAFPGGVMSESWIGIGANLGDARAAFDAAWLELGQHPAIQRRERSGIYQTNPVGAHAGGAFFNAVFSLTTTLPPVELLELLQAIETGLGRTRGVRWGPRPIDLDLLFVDQLVLSTSRLTLPHPAAWYRRFVIDPLAEVAPSLSHPLLHETVAQLHARLTTRPLIVACHDSALSSIASRQASLQTRFPDVQLVPAGSKADPASIGIQLHADDPAGPSWHGVPVADLTTTPGDPVQRVTDFLMSVVDEPRRVGDW